MFRIKEVRERVKKTQEQLSKDVSVSREYISAIENGRYCPSIALLKRIAQALDTTITELIVDDESYDRNC